MSWQARVLNEKFTFAALDALSRSLMDSRLFFIDELLDMLTSTANPNKLPVHTGLRQRTLRRGSMCTGRSKGQTKTHEDTPGGTEARVREYWYST